MRLLLTAVFLAVLLLGVVAVAAVAGTAGALARSVVRLCRSVVRVAAQR